MTIDIRELLQKAEGPSDEIDEAITIELKKSDHKHPEFRWAPHSTDYDCTIAYLEARGCDWIIANVNGQVGGTPWACVGVTEDKASYAATPLLSLWLSFFRFMKGDERYL